MSDTILVNIVLLHYTTRINQPYHLMVRATYFTIGEINFAGLCHFAMHIIHITHNHCKLHSTSSKPTFSMYVCIDCITYMNST